MSVASSSFPGGTSVTLLDVYEDEASDGLCGGSPHMHLVSTESYIVVAGTGELHTIDATGVHETPLREGSVVWFTPGTIHRAINHGGLRVVVVMSNAGLPEAGDAVMTFPAAITLNIDDYAAAASLGESGGARAGRAERARRRRDLAVDGFLTLAAAVRGGDTAALNAFYSDAAAIVAERAKAWPELITERPLRQAQDSLAAAMAIARGDSAPLNNAALHHADSPRGEPVFGMCGLLRTFDVND